MSRATKLWPTPLTGTCRADMCLVQSSLCQNPRASNHLPGLITRASYEFVGVPVGHSLALPSFCTLELAFINSTRGDLVSCLVCQCPGLCIRYYPQGKPTSFRRKYSLKYFCSYYKVAHGTQQPWRLCASVGMLLYFQRQASPLDYGF